MPVKVLHEDLEKSLTAEKGTTVEEIIRKVGVNPETVITEKDGEIVSNKETVDGDECLHLINVVSGG